MGFAELLVSTIICLWAIGTPAIIIYLLIRIHNRIKNIEDKLKDK